MFGVFDVVCILHNELRGTFDVGYFEDMEPWGALDRPKITLEGKVHRLSEPTYENAVAEVTEIRRNYKLEHIGNIITEVVYPIVMVPRAVVPAERICWVVQNWQYPKARSFLSFFPGRRLKMNAWVSILDTDPFG